MMLVGLSCTTLSSPKTCVPNLMTVLKHPAL